MSDGDSDLPGLARRRLRLALRSAREQAGLSQSDVAERMEWSLSKVVRIENGDVTIAPNDLRPLLGYLGVEPPERVAGLIEAARVARSRAQVWSQRPEIREHLTGPMRQLIDYEAEAVASHSYSVFQVPGTLQLPEYASALLDAWGAELTPDQRRVRAEARRRRHDLLLARVGVRRATVLLDESVFLREIGGPAVLAAQLRELLRLIDLGVVEVRTIRFAAGIAVSNSAGFELLFLGADGDLSNAVLYRETGTFDEIVEDVSFGRRNASGPVARHYDRYLRIWEAAESEEDTVAFVKQRIGALASNG